MTRRGRRGTDGTYGDEPWAPAGQEWSGDGEEYAPDWDQAQAPWEVPGWHQEADLPAGHPSGPLPRGGVPGGGVPGGAHAARGGEYEGPTYPVDNAGGYPPGTAYPAGGYGGSHTTGPHTSGEYPVASPNPYTTGPNRAHTSGEYPAATLSAYPTGPNRAHTSGEYPAAPPGAYTTGPNRAHTSGEYPAVPPSAYTTGPQGYGQQGRHTTGPHSTRPAAQQRQYQTGPQPSYTTGPQRSYPTGPQASYPTGAPPDHQTGSQPGYATGEQPGYRPRHGPGAYEQPGGYAQPGDDGGYGSAGYGVTGTQGPGAAGYAEPVQDYSQPDAGYSDAAYGTGYGESAAGYAGGQYDPGAADAATSYAPDQGYSGDAPGYEGYPAPDGYGHVTAGGPPEEWAAEPGAAQGHGPDSGYGDGGDWYGDVDDQRAWADEDYDADFVPGLDQGNGTRRADGGRPGRGRAPSGGGRKPRRRGMRRVAPLIALAVLFIMLAGAGGGYWWLYTTYLHPPDYSGSGTGSVEIQIQSGETATAVGQILFDKGVVASTRAFSNAAKASGNGGGLEPGFYILHKKMSAKLAFQLLLSQKSRVQTTVTIPEGLRLSDIITVLGRATHDLSGYRQAIKEIPKLGLPSIAKGNPEGYLFPATYSIQPGTAPLQVLRNMVLRFDQEAGSVNLRVEAARGLIPESQVIIVASLIEAEGGRLSDYPKIAEVIYNRLNHGMPLQLDSTVLYGLHKYGFIATLAETQINTPFNTYMHTGLPPSPIDSPGDAAIRAALHPDRGGLTYFVTVDPKHKITKFTSSYAVFQQYKLELEHNLATGK